MVDRFSGAPSRRVRVARIPIGNVKDVDEAFTIIDGVGGNGVITLKKFVEGIEELQCNKFKGENEEARIEGLFRYLDPGGEGSISKGEWQVLAQLWKELDESIREFVQFLTFTCGDDLEVAWASLDENGDGNLSLEEWLNAVLKIGYFGPAKAVFALLDNSDDGAISWDEFQRLEGYKPGVSMGTIKLEQGTISAQPSEA